MIQIRTSIILILIGLFIFSAGCDDDEMTTSPLPTGCGSGSGIYATQIISSNISCIPTNAFTDADAILGAPDGRSSGAGKNDLEGVVALGINGSVTTLMGSCVQDLPGPDIRVYQAVSREAVEIQISLNADGPYVSLGAIPCNDPPPYFDGFCDFDMAGSGISQARFIRVIDRETLVFPNAECDNSGTSPGADIDAVQILHPVS